MKPRKIAIVGPTATGKSELAVELAHELGGQVVNADSMQVYEGMDIGTAKLTTAERAGIAHHLLDIWPVTKTASLAEYQALAINRVDEVNNQQQMALLVGGSGMYVQAVVDGWQIPGTDPQLRAQLEAELAVVGSEKMHARLADREPQVAAAILPTNDRRIVRALEVIELQGSFVASLPTPSPSTDWLLLGLDVPGDELDGRVKNRVQQMWANGLVDEVRGLERRGLRDGVTSSRALGYAQVLRFLAGEISEDEAREATSTATRRFVRRQRSWFRRDKRIVWLAADSGPRDRLLAAAMEVIEQPA